MPRDLETMLGWAAAAAATVAAIIGGALVLDSHLQIANDFLLFWSVAPILIKLLRKTRGGLIIKSTTPPSYDIISIWQETLAARAPDATAIIFEETRMSFGELDALSTKLARFLWEMANIQGGATLALVMENRPEFVAWWIAAAKIAVKIAFVNVNLRAQSLAHAIDLCGACCVIVDSTLDLDAMLTAENASSLPRIVSALSNPTVIGHDSRAIVVTHETLRGIGNGSLSDDALAARRDVKFLDTFAFIFTSGTTGLPKAAPITHARYFLFGSMLTTACRVTPADIVYTSGMPLYHTAAGALGVGMMVCMGCTVVIARRFSPRQFWIDVQRHQCTIVQYIGELCRYLVLHHKSKSSDDKSHVGHCIRLAVGNGLRADVWDDFQDLLAIPVVAESYGSTELNGGIVNICTTRSDRGAVGRMGAVARRALGVRLASFDVTVDELVRDAHGRCVDARVGEVGELLMPMKPSLPHTHFAGYVNDETATRKKVLVDAFVTGDRFCRSGDLLRRNNDGRYFFVDRIGDTFRWKGENVSTTEVAEVMTAFRFNGAAVVTQANVYGVEIAGCEGRACMAAIELGAAVTADDVLLRALSLHCARLLPSYARPMYLRLLTEPMEITTTFKQMKMKMKQDAYNADRCAPDDVFVAADASFRPIRSPSAI